MTKRISVRAIVTRNNKLLCVRLKPYNEVSSQMTGSWCIPGGGLDYGEPLVKGLEREMLEETGVLPDVGPLLYVQQFTHNDIDYLEFFFHVKNTEDYLRIDLEKTTHGALEIAEIDFVNPITTPILPAFLMTESLLSKISSHSPPTIFSYS